MKLEFKQIRSSFTFWFLMISILPLLILSFIFYQQRVTAIKEEAFHKLIAIRDLKVQQLNGWVDKREGDMKTISGDMEIRRLEGIFYRHGNSNNKSIERKIARDLLHRYLKNYVDYEELSIINPVSGKVEISTKKSFEGIDRSGDSYFINPIKLRDIYIKDIYYSKTLNKASMAFAIPVYCSLHQGKHISSILVARIDLHNSLYALLLNRTGMGATGETLIVNKEVFALNELRWHHNAPLRLKIYANPAIMASEGKTGITETEDYRGEMVLAAYTHIKKTGWGFVAKQDLVEIYAPIYRMIQGMLITLLIIAFLVYTLGRYLSAMISRPILEMTSVAKRLKEGDTIARNNILGVDEVSYLARAFNDMADKMTSRMKVQEKNTDFIKSIVSAEDLDDFRNTLLANCMEVTDSNFGAYYILDDDKEKFEHYTSIGLESEVIETFDRTYFEGQIGQALKINNISFIKEIPEETSFKFKTFIGSIIPKEIVTIPILIKNRALEIITLGNIRNYSDESIEILNLVWMSINTALSNQLASAEVINKNTELYALAQELQAQSKELERQNIELEQQRIQVEEASRLKSGFLSNMSHELRTPLNSIMALSRVLIMQGRDRLNSDEMDYLEIIDRNGRTLLNLINDILDLSKIESGKIDLNITKFSISPVIKQVVESVKPLADEKKLEININLLSEFPEIESDKTRVIQILLNIIGNSVKFTEKGSIAVNAYLEKSAVYIKVKDTGIGISEEDLPRMFNEFWQADSSSSRCFEGTGLGLAISYKSAKLLNGDILVESEPGKGASFTLVLPIEWGGIAARKADIITQPERTRRPGLKKILVIDDDPAAVELISDYLCEQGYHAISATSGKEGLELAESQSPFAITLDILMPVMDGWEVLQKLKTSSGTADIPVIIVSISDDKETGLALGAVGYVTKPVIKGHLIREINRIGRIAPRIIMIVDDNERDRKEMAEIVESNNMVAVTADNGRKCIEKIKEAAPDVLVLDLLMPEMDGFEVINVIRGDIETADLPVIIVSAKDLTNEDRKKLSGKVYSVLSKGAGAMEALLKEINKLLKQIEYDFNGKKQAKKILMVEDNEAAFIQVKSILSGEGYILDSAGGGHEALDYVSHTIPDAIILDLMMPDIDGFEVFEKIRSMEETKDIPVLILTARDLSREDINKLSSNHIQQFVQKGDVNPEELKTKVRLLFTDKGRTKMAPAPEEPAECQIDADMKRSDVKRKGRKARILIIEDNPDNMKVTKKILAPSFDTLEAKDGISGLKSALSTLPDLILLDVMLPGIDGYEVIRRIREDKNARGIPVIAITAQAMHGDMEKLMSAGCDDYISKPMDIDLLQEKVKKYLHHIPEG